VVESDRHTTLLLWSQVEGLEAKHCKQFSQTNSHAHAHTNPHTHGPPPPRCFDAACARLSWRRLRGLQSHARQKQPTFHGRSGSTTSTPQAKPDDNDDDDNDNDSGNVSGGDDTRGDISSHTRERSPHSRAPLRGAAGAASVAGAGAGGGEVAELAYQFQRDDDAWPEFLKENGYVVVKGVASPEVIA
jgi:hypothetical protein